VVNILIVSQDVMLNEITVFHLLCMIDSCCNCVN